MVPYPRTGNHAHINAHTYKQILIHINIYFKLVPETTLIFLRAR